MGEAAASRSHLHRQEARERRLLLEDGVLVLEAQGDAAAFVESWLPRTPRRWPARHLAPAQITVTMADRAPVPPARPDPCIQLLGVRGWADDPDHIGLGTIDGSLAGRVDLAMCRATIEIAASGRTPQTARDLFWTLTVAAALLLGRRHRILVHAAAFLAPNGSAWLLVGESHSGKSSTCANLIRLGWGYLADDQVVIGSRAGSLRVEGLPRAFHLDHGFADGTTTGQRSPADPGSVGSGPWTPGAPLGGLLFPRIDPDRPTTLTPLGSTDALQELIRQSPWLLADRAAAPEILARMLEMVALPTYSLVLGSDTYRDPAGLAQVLMPALDGLPNGAADMRRADNREHSL